MPRLLLNKMDDNSPVVNIELKDSEILPILLQTNEPLQLRLLDGGILFIGHEVYNKSIITIRP